MSVRLAEIAEKLTCIDCPNKFFSPSLADHVTLNNISNIEFSVVEDVVQYVKNHHNSFNAIYIDESHDQINDLISFLGDETKSLLTVVYNDKIEDCIKVVSIKPKHKTIVVEDKPKVVVETPQESPVVLPAKTTQKKTAKTRSKTTTN